MIKAVLFDMDGLMVDTEPLWRAAEKVVFAKVNIHLTDNDFDHFVGFKINEVVAHWFKQKPWTTFSEKEIEQQILDELIGLIEKSLEKKEGLDDVLHFFNSKNIPLAIASSSPSRIINAVTKKLAIQSNFKIIHSAEVEEYGKPHPAVYINAAKRLNVDTKECLVLEDSFNGLLAAKAALCKTIAVPELHNYNQTRFDIADFKLKSLKEFNQDIWAKLQLRITS